MKIKATRSRVIGTRITMQMQTRCKFISVASRRKPFVACDYRDTAHVWRATLRRCGRRQIGITAVGIDSGYILNATWCPNLNSKQILLHRMFFIMYPSFPSLYAFCRTNVFEQISAAFELRFTAFIKPQAVTGDGSQVWVWSGPLLLDLEHFIMVLYWSIEVLLSLSLAGSSKKCRSYIFLRIPNPFPFKQIPNHFESWITIARRKRQIESRCKWRRYV